VFEKQTLLGPPPLDRPVKLLLTFWCVLLVVGALPGLMLTGMAFEGGNTFAAYYSVIIVWLYPALVAVAFLFRRKKPELVWLPLIPLTLMLLSVETNWPR